MAIPSDEDVLKISLNPSGDNYQYYMYPISSVDYTQEKPTTSISLPGQGYKDNVLMGVEGMSADITIQWYIHDDGNDKADGSYTSTIVSIKEQLDYLRDTILAESFTASWELDDVNGSRFNSLEVAINNINPPIYQNDSPKWLQARMDLTVGGTV